MIKKKKQHKSNQMAEPGKPNYRGMKAETGELTEVDSAQPYWQQLELFLMQQLNTNQSSLREVT